ALFCRILRLQGVSPLAGGVQRGLLAREGTTPKRSTSHRDLGGRWNPHGPSGDRANLARATTVDDARSGSYPREERLLRERVSHARHLLERHANHSRAPVLLGAVHGEL